MVFPFGSLSTIFIPIILLERAQDLYFRNKSREAPKDAEKNSEIRLFSWEKNYLRHFYILIEDKNFEEKTGMTQTILV